MDEELNETIKELMSKQRYNDVLELCNNALLKRDYFSNEFLAFLYYTKGFIFHNYQKYEDAIECFDEAIILNPNEPSFYCYRGDSKGANDEYFGAINDYTYAIECFPQENVLYFKRGFSYEMLYENNNAQKDYLKAIELGLKDSNIFYHLAVVQDREKQYKEAIESLTLAIDIQQSSNAKAYLYYKRGEIKSILEDNESALKDYKLSLELEPDNEDCKNAIEYIEYNMESDAKNIEQIKILSGKIDNNIDLVDSYYQRAELYYRISKYNEAISDFTKLIELSNSKELANIQKYALMKIPHCYHYMENYHDEVSAYKTAVQYFPNDIDVYEQLAYAQKEYLADIGGAIITYKDALKNCLNIKDLHYELAQLYFKLKDYEQSEKFLLKDIEIKKSENCHESYQLLGDIKFAQEQYKDAICFYNKALGQGETFEISIISDLYNFMDFFIVQKIAKAEIKLKNYDNALEKLNALIEIGSYNDELIIERAKLYLTLGKKAEALQDITRALNLDNNNKELMELRELIINEKS